MGHMTSHDTGNFLRDETARATARSDSAASNARLALRGNEVVTPKNAGPSATKGELSINSIGSFDGYL